MDHPRSRRTRPFIVYHWAPISRRKSIQRRGLVVGSRCVVRTPGWKPTYLCFSDSPSYAWALSAGTMEMEGWWDLWMCWSIHVPGGLRIRGDHVGMNRNRTCKSYLPAEFRSTESIPKEKLWMVGSRFHQPRKRKKK